ncbi:DUF952 domain-containing protein [Nonomuraea sp. NPDC050404]|uniref:DUF952 domain-containing protein n=1 Tax=Nonomuraea sp. NPDC050404 TaxID=3155783 RepID=UPI0033CE7148
MNPPDPGRERGQERGRRRRATLLTAAVALLTEGGFAAVTHRAVAHRAGLPLAATTYYFTSRDQLLAEAFAQLVDTELATTRTWITSHGLTGLIDQITTADRTRQLGLWELYVHAGRHPALRHIARRWTDGCVHAIAETLHLPATDPRTRLLYTTISTLWLELIVEQRPADEARTLLTHALHHTGTDAMTTHLHHLALRTDWEAAQKAGEYRISTLGRTYEEEGFIHCSLDLTQLHGVHTAFYGHVTEPLLILDIDPTGLDIRLENGFPHLYGPLPTTAVTATRPY